MTPRLRTSVRAIVLDEEDRVLLCRFDLADQGVIVWATPGGGIEPGEHPYQALQRELDEELGLRLTVTPPLVWHQRVVAPGHAAGYDGVVNDCYLVRTAGFEPNGSLGGEALAEENISQFRWWTLEELQTYRGDELFAPRDLPTLLADLLERGVPPEPLTLGL